jgi:hypothetical protein
VEIGDGGRLETLYNAAAGGNTNPITLGTGVEIIDSERDSGAFLPGYSTGFIWANDTGSLQKGKNIQLNGIRPRSDGNIAVSGKTAYTTNEWYFKKGETIELTLSSEDTTTNNLILPGSGGNPRIEFNVGSEGPYYAEWQRSANNGRSMVFSLPVDALGDAPDGQIQSLTLNTIGGTIVNGVGNELVSTTNGALTLTLGGRSIFIDRTPPVAPIAYLNGVVPPAAPNNNYGVNPTLTISAASTTDEPRGVARTEYSLNNGFDWVIFPNARNEVNYRWTVLEGSNLRVLPGDWIMRTRYIDKAGNEGELSNNTFSVNSDFPELKSITALQPNGIYTQATGRNSLQFNLVFADTVRTDVGNVTITLSNRTNAYSTATPEPTYQKQLTATATALSNTVSCSWTGIADKQMLDGLYISRVDFSGLRDKYGNIGGTGTATTANEFRLSITKGATNYNCANLNGAGIIVDCIAPTLSSMTPVNAQDRPAGNRATSVMTSTGDNYNRIITLTFNEAVQAGSGTITIKPHGDYNIPPVFENDSYYLNVRTGERSPTVRSGYTRITGFYDIYNATPAAMRASLTQGSSMTNLTLDARTGQSAGPYIKMTQGLKRGAGYSGNYNNNMATAQFNYNDANGPNVDRTQDYMVPDTSTKWVLDYRYSINNDQNTQVVPATAGDPALTPLDNNNNVVPNIRAALNAAKFRWQEIDVTAGIITYSGDRKTVTITLPEALENGLQWDIVYPLGTFTDLAGHPAPAVAEGSSWFISRGAQIPVIRVNRKSFDARTGGTAGNWQAENVAYAVPQDRGGLGGPGGWGIGDFNRVHYRIETETPDATLSSRTINGRNVTSGTTSIGSIYVTTAAINHTNNATVNDSTWAVTVSGGGTVTNTTAADWNATGATRGQMVRPNLIRRATTNTPNNWLVIDEYGVQSTRAFAGTHRGFKSYNRDALRTELEVDGTLTPITPESPVSSGTALYFEYYSTEASKNYVIAQASINHGTNASFTSSRGYEGVFRSVVALLQTGVNPGTNTNGTGNPVRHYVEGSNVKNGMPSIAGFPVRDAEETGDNRYIKYFYRSTTYDRQFLWVSTEIMSEWYFIKYGYGYTHMSSGDVNNYLIAGYGDLTFGFNVTGN